MTDSLIQLHPQVKAVRDWLDDSLDNPDVTVYESSLPADATGLFVLIVGRPGDSVALPMARDATQDLHLITYSCGPTLDHALALGTQVRARFVERAQLGGFVYDPGSFFSDAGLALLERVAPIAAAPPEVIAMVPQMSDEFTLTLGRA